MWCDKATDCWVPLMYSWFYLWDIKTVTYVHIYIYVYVYIYIYTHTISHDLVLYSVCRREIRRYSRRGWFYTPSLSGTSRPEAQPWSLPRHSKMGREAELCTFGAGLPFSFSCRDCLCQNLWVKLNYIYPVYPLVNEQRNITILDGWMTYGSFQ